MTKGASVSMTMSLEPAMLLPPVGTVVPPSAFPKRSNTPSSVYEEMVRSVVFSPAWTTYVPVSVVAFVAVESMRRAPVLSVTSMEEPARTVSDIVATIVMDSPTV